MSIGFLSKEEPNYIVITPQQLDTHTRKSYNLFGIVTQPIKGKWVNKPAYKYDLSWFDGLWRPLPRLHSKLPLEYKDIYKLLKK